MGVLTVGRIKVCIWCPQSFWCVYSFYRSVAKISFVMAFYTYPGKALTLSFHCLKYRTIYFWHLLFVLNTAVCITRVSIHKAASERAISSPCSDSTEKPPDVVTVWLRLLLPFHHQVMRAQLCPGCCDLSSDLGKRFSLAAPALHLAQASKLQQILLLVAPRGQRNGAGCGRRMVSSLLR